MLEQMDTQIAGKRDGSWTIQQHEMFVQGLTQHGKNWTKILEYVPTRSGTQIRSHAQKFFNKLESQFEPRTILGQQSNDIMGPPQNQKQFRIYLNIGSSCFISGEIQQPDHFSYLPYSVKPRISRKIKVKQTTQNQNTSKYQETKNTVNSLISPTFTFMQQDRDSSSNQSYKAKTTTGNSFFSEIILQDKTLKQIGSNFYQIFVDHPMHRGITSQIDPRLRINSEDIPRRQLMSIQYPDSFHSY